MAAATRHGILVKGGKFLEIGRRLNWVAFDKTGTLTNGRPEQTDFVPFGSMNPLTARELAASLAGRSDHPVSKAISRAAGKGRPDPPPCGRLHGPAGQRHKRRH